MAEPKTIKVEPKRIKNKTTLETLRDLRDILLNDLTGGALGKELPDGKKLNGKWEPKDRTTFFTNLIKLRELEIKDKENAPQESMFDKLKKQGKPVEFKNHLLPPEPEKDPLDIE
ncbi:MAG: hypothetical protein EPO08_20935 [Rhodospirillaceae bacterium]|nr:MAG: hypothetical protein EPO08_20935 [Rhodospirillaceae bacterium]